jgi:fructose-bisphosphate aldolase class 1
MLTLGVEQKEKTTPQQVSDHTFKILKRRVPPTVLGIVFLSGRQSKVEATLNKYWL